MGEVAFTICAFNAVQQFVRAVHPGNPALNLDRYRPSSNTHPLERVSSFEIDRTGSLIRCNETDGGTRPFHRTTLMVADRSSSRQGVKRPAYLQHAGSP